MNLKGIATSKEIKRIEELEKQEEIKSFLEDYNKMILKYTAAMKETVTKLEILNEDFKSRYKHSPIDNIESRIKDTRSLMKKMLRNNLEFDINVIQKNIFDIAGVRIICPFLSDIQTVIKMIQDNDDITILRTKDYISNPKPSGYRSYHMILKIPIYLTTGREDVVVELQIRTMAMDFWASLEHKIKYKYDGIIPDDVKNELIKCSYSISDTDKQMMVLNYKVKQANT